MHSSAVMGCRMYLVQLQQPRHPSFLFPPNLEGQDKAIVEGSRVLGILQYFYADEKFHTLVVFPYLRGQRYKTNYTCTWKYDNDDIICSLNASGFIWHFNPRFFMS